MNRLAVHKFASNIIFGLASVGRRTPPTRRDFFRRLHPQSRIRRAGAGCLSSGGHDVPEHPEGGIWDWSEHRMALR